jgi:hypothetical protein
MKKSIYLKNVEKQIQRQIRWAGVDTKLGRDVFLDRIIEFCIKLQEKPFKPPKSPKTRQG